MVVVFVNKLLWKHKVYNNSFGSGYHYTAIHQQSNQEHGYWFNGVWQIFIGYGLLNKSFVIFFPTSQINFISGNLNLLNHL